MKPVNPAFFSSGTWWKGNLTHFQRCRFVNNTPDSPAFRNALAFVLSAERGYVNDPTDRGGETNFGISDKRDGVADGMTDVNGDGKPDTRIRDLTVEQAGQIYFRDYW